MSRIDNRHSLTVVRFYASALLAATWLEGSAATAALPSKSPQQRRRVPVRWDYATTRSVPTRGSLTFNLRFFC